MSDFTFPPGFNEITDNYFTTEAQALAEIAAMGWNPLVRDVVIAKDEELHWHDFESVTFVVSGTVRVAYESRHAGLHWPWPLAPGTRRLCLSGRFGLQEQTDRLHDADRQTPGNACNL
jgi:hypothetical protein